MKYSGIEWIGEIPDDWGLLRIGLIFRCRNEKVNDTDYPPLSVTRNGIVPQMESVAKTDANDNRKLVKSNDFVINSRSDRKQSCGVSDLEGSVSLINTVLFTENDDIILPAYTNLIMKNYGFAEEFYRWGHGIVADLWTTRWQEMKSIVLPLPSVFQQKKIIEEVYKKCAEIDRLIAHEEAMIDELKAYKQSVITEVVTKGLDSSVPMKDSGVDWIGEIPLSWQICKLTYVCSIITDFVASGSFSDLKSNVQYLDEPDYAMLVRTTDLSGSSRSENKVYINEDAYKFLNNSNLFGGEIILPNIGASCGDVYIVPKLYEKMSLAPNAIMFKTKYNDKYFYYFFKSKCGREMLQDLCASTAQQKFNKTELRLLRVPLVPLVEQDIIVSYLDKRCAAIDSLQSIKQQKIDELKAYKKSLIYEYVTGKKEVCE